MVTRLCIFVVCAMSVSAQNYSVTFWKDVEGKPAGLPDYMPCNVRTHPIGTSTNVIPPAILMTRAQFELCVRTNQVKYYAALEKIKQDELIKATLDKETKTASRRVSIKQKLDLIADSEKRWPTLTDSQKLNLVRVQSQVLVELRDMLEQLYRNKLEEQ